MAQKTAWDAAALSESDINTYLMHEGGAWSTWTPAVVQSGAVSSTVTRARYARAGRLIHFQVSLAITSAGTAANNVTISLPVTAAAANLFAGGGGQITDASASLNYMGLPYVLTTTTVGLAPAAVGVGFGLLGTVSFTAALASGDAIIMSGFYEAAS